MKKNTNLFGAFLIIIAAIFTMPLNVLAEQEAGTVKDDTVFQKASDVINGKYEVETVPFKKIGIFQKMADSISTLSRK